MKILFFILIIGVYSIFSQKLFMSEVINEKVNLLKHIGKVSKIAVYNFEVLKENNTIKLKFIRNDLSFYIKYDNNDSIIAEGNLKSEKNILNAVKNIYNKNKVKTIGYDSLKRIEGYAIYEYDDNDNLIELLYKDKDDNMRTKRNFEYKNNSLFKETLSLPNQSEDYFYEFNSNNLLVKQTREIFKNTFHNIYLEYNINNKIVSKVEEIQNKKTFGFFYKYDDFNRIVEAKTKVFHNNNEELIKYSYNENGEIEEKISVIDGNETKSKFIYKYDDKGNWIYRYEYINGVYKYMIKRVFVYQ